MCKRSRHSVRFRLLSENVGARGEIALARAEAAQGKGDGIDSHLTDGLANLDRALRMQESEAPLALPTLAGLHRLRLESAASEESARQALPAALDVARR